MKEKISTALKKMQQKFSKIYGGGVSHKGLFFGIKKVFPKEVLSSFALSAVFAFMLFVYAPFEVFLSNTQEFWFGAEHLFPVTLLGFLAFFALSFAILLLAFFASKKQKVIFDIAISLVFALFLGMYMQGNYIPRNYGVLDGREINWKDFRGYAIASVVLWPSVFAGVALVFFKFKKSLCKIIFFASGFVLFALLVAIVPSFFKAERMDAKNSVVVTKKDFLSVSKEKNVIVLLLDTFDANFLKDALNEEGEVYSKMLEDFTFYEDALGGYPTTRGSMPLIYTGQFYKNDVPYEDYVERAQKEAALYDFLRQEGWSLCVYGNTGISREEGFYDNVFSGKYSVKNKAAFFALFLRLVLFEYAPHQLKKHFVVYTGDFDGCKKSPSDDAKKFGVYNESNDMLSLYEDLENGGLFAKDTLGAFKFYHMRGMHGPYSFGEDLKSDKEKKFIRDDALKGNMNLVGAYLRALKRAGCYDNSAVIIMADHGDGSVPWFNCNPLLLVKNFSERHEFRVSSAKVSWKDIYPTLCALVTGKDDSNAVWNITEGERERKFMYYQWDDSWSAAYLPITKEYLVKGKVPTEISQFEPTGNIFNPNPNEKKSGLSLEGKAFLKIPVEKNNAFFRRFYVTGLEKAKGKKGAKSKGYYTQFKLAAQNCNFPCKFTAEFSESENFDPDRKVYQVHASVDGNRQDINFQEGKLSFDIPSETLQKGGDIFIFYSHKESFVFTEITLEKRQPCVLKDEIVFDFRKGGNFLDLIPTGWNGQESWGVWAAKNSSVMISCTGEADIVMEIDAGHLSSEIETQVFVNEMFLKNLSRDSRHTLKIPRRFLNKEFQKIEFRTENAATPKSLGINGDSRTLSIGVTRIAFFRPGYTLGKIVSFSRDDNGAKKHIESGFLPAENWGAWMGESEASLRFFIERSPYAENFLLSMDIFSNRTRRVLLYANETKIDEWAAQSGIKTARIPRAALLKGAGSDGTLFLRFELPELQPNETPEITQTLGLKSLCIQAEEK